VNGEDAGAMHLRDELTLSLRTLLVSIHSHYAELILDGVKQVELRRRFDIGATGSRLLIYATLPTAAVVGHARIERIECLNVLEIWQKYGAAASIGEDAFSKYFDGVETGCVLFLEKAKRFSKPVPLAEMRLHHRITPPQSYVFLKDEVHRALIEHEQI